ncbi:unnamed protein product [Rhodiola kirilowii]
METSSVSKLLLLLIFCVVVVVESSSVGYDKKAILINGQRRVLISGSIHYPRSTPDMWEDLVKKAKDGGIDVIDTYVFWNVHEPSPGNYDFGGRYDLVRFIKTIQKVGLYAHLRVGPYVCAEWNFGGFPVWLKYVPGISFRTDNKPFKDAMQGFTQKIVQMMKNEKLFASQGGPIILSQIENEYGGQGKVLGAAGHAYMTWAAKLAEGLNTGVPWVMCKEDDAPDPIINTCNGFYCDDFTPNKPYKPKIWTEAWTGWFNEFGGPYHQRPVQDLAFAVTRFIQKGGTFFNYYMYHGGTNFGRTAGGPFITTSYDYDAPLDEYGLIREPKYGHLKELHAAIKLCEPALVSSDPTVRPLGSYQQAYIFSSGRGHCAAFISNYHSVAAKVSFEGRHYKLPAWSTSILPDCKNAVFNTAKVGVQTSKMQMLPTGARLLQWETYDEDINSLDARPTLTANGLLEQVNITRDISDYLWYITSVDVSPSERFLQGGSKPTLSLESKGHAVHVFINGQLSGSAYGTMDYRSFKYSIPANLHPGINRIALLSVAVGLPNVGLHFERWETGVLGPVLLHGIGRGGIRDLSRQKWSYRVGLQGESRNLLSKEGVSSVNWIPSSLAVNKQQPLTWHKAYFNTPGGNEPLALDMQGMGKGQIWINGQSLGRYWLIYAKGDCSACNYVGTFRSEKCQIGCGHPSQRWYHVPRGWLKPTKNLLIVFEELGGDSSRISLVKRTVSSICAKANEHRPAIENYRIESHGGSTMLHESKVHLNCASGQSITAIKFASYGTPMGTCGMFHKGTCHAQHSQAMLEKSCIGNERCAVGVSNSFFGEDPCPDKLKHLSVEAECSP